MNNLDKTAKYLRKIFKRTWLEVQRQYVLGEQRPRVQPAYVRVRAERFPRDHRGR